MNSTKLGKNDNPLLRQILDLIPEHVLRDAIYSYQSGKHCSKYRTYDELVAMIFGQVNKCLTLREIAQGIRVSPKFLRDIKLEKSPACSTMSDGNEKRDYRVFEFIFNQLLKYYMNYYKKRDGYQIIKEIEGKTVKVVDASTIGLCLSLFPWAKFRTAKGGIKLHTSLDEANMLPEIVYITEAQVSDRRGVDSFTYEEYKRRWIIEVFFKLLKQNLHVKTLLGTSENATKSQIYCAMITYLLLELIRRSISKISHCFGHFVTLIRVCLIQYNRLDYIVNEIQQTVQSQKTMDKGTGFKTNKIINIKI